MTKPEPWTQRNDGDTTCFYSCAKCGASIQPADRERHLEWHEELKRKGKMRAANG